MTTVKPQPTALHLVAARPRTPEETGLSRGFLSDLIAKHLFDAGVLTIRELAERTALAGSILEEILNHLRHEACVEIRTRPNDDGNLRYALTERGRGRALAALTVSGYVGPAPIPHTIYADLMRGQSLRHHRITRQRMHESFADLIIDAALLDRLGPALNSRRAIFVYGDPGTGKTFITQQIGRLFDDTVMVPYAISIEDTVIQIYDTAVHTRMDTNAATLLFDGGHDPRLVMCRRPVVTAGGELNAEMLEVTYDATSRQYRAPLQVKANGGLFIVDDLGRQRIEPATLLNRWIVPMEEGKDHFSLASGQNFSVPFDVVLIFSTNVRPEELVDEAFLRRIGYKIRFEALNARQFHALWERVCLESAISCDADLCQWVIDELYEPTATPMLPCHPRDLIRMAIDRQQYTGEALELSSDDLRWAWDNYFVRLADGFTPAWPDNDVNWSNLK